MLVSALYSPHSFSKYSHWSHDGGRELASPPEASEFFLTFLKEASNPKELAAVELELSLSGAIFVQGKGQPDLITTDQDWVIDCRSWCADESYIYRNGVDNMQLCQDLLALYSQFPDRDVHLMAEQYREIIYYHAHAAVMYIFQVVKDKNVELGNVEDGLHKLVLQVFSYRYREGDERITEFLGQRIDPRPRDPGHAPFRVPQYHYRQIMSHLIDLRATRTRQHCQQESPSVSWLQGEIEYLQDAITKREKTGLKAWGMVGYALAELMDFVETTHGQETTDGLVRLTRKWCDTALASRAPVEMAALCCVLVKLRAFDKLDGMPQEYHLSCGYYLARAGFSQLATRYIFSGINYYRQEVPKAPTWRYYLEFWTTKMSQGHWAEAELWLSNTWKHLSMRASDTPDGGFDLWKLSGDLAEFKLNTTSLLSDCYAAQSSFSAAKDMLLIALRRIPRTQFDSVDTMRLALSSRLLNVQMEIENLDDAAVIAISLCCELQEPKILLGSQTISWTIQEVLACINKLVSEEMYSTAYHVLCLLKRLFYSAKSYGHRDTRLDDLIDYFHERWDEVKQRVDPFHHITWKTHDVLYHFGRLGCCFKGSLDKLNDFVASLPYRYIQEKLERGVAGLEFHPRAIRQESSLGSSVFLTQTASNSDEVQIQGLDLSAPAQEVPHGMQDLLYGFPPPTSRSEAIQMATIESPRAKDP